MFSQDTTIAKEWTGQGTRTGDVLRDAMIASPKQFRTHLFHGQGLGTIQGKR